MPQTAPLATSNEQPATTLAARGRHGRCRRPRAHPRAQGPARAGRHGRVGRPEHRIGLTSPAVSLQSVGQRSAVDGPRSQSARHHAQWRNPQPAKRCAARSKRPAADSRASPTRRFSTHHLRSPRSGDGRATAGHFALCHMTATTAACCLRWAASGSKALDYSDTDGSLRFASQVEGRSWPVVAPTGEPSPGGPRNRSIVRPASRSAVGGFRLLCRD